MRAAFLVILLAGCLLGSCLAEPQRQQQEHPDQQQQIQQQEQLQQLVQQTDVQQQQQQNLQQSIREDADRGGEDAPSREHGNQLNEVDQRGLPIYTTLNGTKTNLNEILSTIRLNRTEAVLNCSQGSMQVELNFQEPFYGLAYADFDRNSACMTKGRGHESARIELPLKGCGTVQGPSRVFTNNIVVRFHPFLEMDGDEVITIVCRYPPAITNPPANVPAPRLQDKGSEAPLLSGMHMLLMICTLLFLSLLLLGLGCSYMCLRGRPVTVIHRTRITGSEITKITDSTEHLSHRSLFDDFKIPRIGGTHQIYGSEAHLVVDQSDTLPSDYPSESHSEVEQRASSSLYSETINELESTAVTASRISQSRHVSHLGIEPKFEVQMRVKQAPAPPSPLPSESEVSLALERNLTTILEREESSRTLESGPGSRLTSFAYVPELHAPPGVSRQQTPPVYSRILRKQAEREVVSCESAELHRPRSLTSLTGTTEMTESRSLTEVTDASHAKYRVASMLAPTGAPGPALGPRAYSSHLSEEYREERREEVEPLVEPVVASRRPEITTHEVDDVFLRTVTEKKTIEDIERHRRQVTEYHARQQQLQPDPKWDVTIRNYPTQELAAPAPPDWENFSDVSSASNLTIAGLLESSQLQQHRSQYEQPIDARIQPTYTLAPRQGLGPEEPDRPGGPSGPGGSSAAGWFNLERVLEEQYAAEFTEDERKKWREIITTESTLRTLLTEAIVREDYELIRKDLRYVNLFPPAKWDVIIRIISPANGAGSVSSSSHGKSGQRYKRGKATDWDNRSRRSSLPTLYEYESDGGSSARTFGQEQLRMQPPGSGVPGARIRKLSSTTRGGSEADLRSMSEMTVRDFARLDRDDQTSLSSYDGESLVRSLSQPSLARSGSEFTEHWAVPARNLPHWGIDDEPCSSTETTPRPIRREVLAYDEVARHHQSAAGPPAPTAGASSSSSSFVRSSNYSEVHRVQQASASGGPGARPSSWFHDDSEPEMQI